MDEGVGLKNQFERHRSSNLLAPAKFRIIMKKLSLLLALSIFFAVGCGNADMKELNPDGGTIVLYSVNGGIIKIYKTDGKPEMHTGGHLYCREKGTNKLIIIYGTYTFEEN